MDIIFHNVRTDDNLQFFVYNHQCPEQQHVELMKVILLYFFVHFEKRNPWCMVTHLSWS